LFVEKKQFKKTYIILFFSENAFGRVGGRAIAVNLLLTRSIIFAPFLSERGSYDPAHVNFTAALGAKKNPVLVCTGSVSRI